MKNPETLEQNIRRAMRECAFRYRRDKRIAPAHAAYWLIRAIFWRDYFKA